MKNEATWKTANNYAPKLFVPIGVLTILIAIVGFFVFDKFYLIVVIFFVLGLISIILLTEWHPHKHFDKDGNPKNE
jgi:tellurite resistance protein TehA-like permease